MSASSVHTRLLAIVTKLPGAYEDRPWGSVHCKVDGKIFVGWGENEAGETSLGFRTNKDLQSMLIDSDPRFTMAKYVGKYGGIDMAIGKTPDWAEIEHFIVESYRIIAPKRRVKELDAGAAPAARPKPAKKAAPKKAAKAAPKKAVAAPRAKAAAKRKRTAR